MKRLGFKPAKQKALEALRRGNYQIAVRTNLDAKNLLSTGEVTESDLISIIERCQGQNHERRPHDQIPQIDVHILKRDGWYIKFFFLDPDTFFLSVHR